MHTEKKRKLMSLLTVASVLALTLSLDSCKSDDLSPSTKESAAKLLTSASWKVQSVTIDGIDKTSVFSGLILSFTTSSFTAINGDPVWPASGTWNFLDEEAKIIERNDGLEITVSEISENKLGLTLDWSKTTFETGRNLSMKGVHKFNFGK